MEKIGEVKVIGPLGVRRVEPIYRVDRELDDIEQREIALREMELRIAKQSEILELYDAKGNLVFIK